MANWSLNFDQEMETDDHPRTLSSLNEKIYSGNTHLQVMEDSKRTSYTKKYKPILLGSNKENVFLCFYIMKSIARKGQNTPKYDFRGPKIPPRGASSTWNM